MIEQHHDNICYLQFEQLLQFPTIIHGVFTRQGGYSEGQYRGLNTLGTIKGGDNHEHVVYNRQLALQALGIQDYPCVTLWGVHSADVVEPALTEDWRTDWGHPSYYTQAWTPQSIHKADAMIMRQSGLATALSFADCTPIVFYDPIVQAAGITHAGWRGTARGIVLATIEMLRERFGCQPHNLYAGIGPAIGPCCYEVSEDVRSLVRGQLRFDDAPTNERYRGIVRESAVFSTVALPDRSSLRFDLWETNRNQLLMAGLRPEHIEVAGICTACNTDRFFSHRAENGKTGRFPAIVALQTQ